jgi:hypothetical protein
VYCTPKGEKTVAKRKQKTEHPNPHPDWVISDTIKVNGRIVEKNTELSITGQSGRFLFIKHVKTPTTEWIDCIGGKAQYRVFRSFRPDQIKTVHWKNKTRQNLG